MRVQCRARPAQPAAMGKSYPRARLPSLAARRVDIGLLSKSAARGPDRAHPHCGDRAEVDEILARRRASSHRPAQVGHRTSRATTASDRSQPSGSREIGIGQQPPMIAGKPSAASYRWEPVLRPFPLQPPSSLMRSGRGNSEEPSLSGRSSPVSNYRGRFVMATAHRSSPLAQSVPTGSPLPRSDSSAQLREPPETHYGRI